MMQKIAGPARLLPGIKVQVIYKSVEVSIT
jgi:hypothetical protein